MNTRPPIVTMLTDFGWQDSYVAEMKGVLLSRRRDLTIVDISHDVPPQDVEHGAYVLGTAATRFPSDTIHIGVVDPGVGTSRKAILVDHEIGRFIGPDNGLFSTMLSDGGMRSVREIPIPDAVGRTFHGRDVFAPAAAHLLQGEDPAAQGGEVSSPVILDRWRAEVGDLEVVGRIVHIDAFGNAITNIHREALAGRSIQRIKAGGVNLSTVSDTYGDVDEGEPVALIGSQDTLEISVNGGDAAGSLRLERGQAVSVRWQA